MKQFRIDFIEREKKKNSKKNINVEFVYSNILNVIEF